VFLKNEEEGDVCLLVFGSSSRFIKKKEE